MSRTLLTHAATKVMATFSLTALLTHAGFAGNWEWSWPPAPGEETATATVAPMKYGKLWGYAIELDDGGRETGLYAPGFFANYHFTDAPPGVPGGKELPVVGSLAVVVGGMNRNSSVVSYDDLRELPAKGWNVTNHSFAHQGRSYGNPPHELTPEEIREDLFWSQAILAVETGDGRSPTHFVYPNGYKGYGPFLNEFGLVSGSLVGGSGGRNLQSDKLDLLYLTRNYLDTGAWKGGGEGNPMKGLEDKATPKEHDIIIDFTHGLNPDPASDNYKLWNARMDTFAAKWGAKGTDEFWSAPVADIVAYHLAAKNGKINYTPGKVQVTLPDDQPGSAITLKLEGVPEAAKIPVPDGGAMYRQGTTVWLTSPVIGQAGLPAPKPKVKQVFKGKAEEVIELPQEAKIALVAIKLNGHGEEGQVVKAEVIQPDGRATLIGKEVHLKKEWTSGLRLFSAIPNGEPITGKSIRMTVIDKLVHEVEVWAVDEG